MAVYIMFYTTIKWRWRKNTNTKQYILSKGKQPIITTRIILLLEHMLSMLLSYSLEKNLAKIPAELVWQNRHKLHSDACRKASH